MSNTIIKICKPYSFIVAVVILLFSAIGLKPSLNHLSNYYQKESIVLKRSLRDFDPLSFSMVEAGWSFRHVENTEEFGTEEYALVYFSENTTPLENIGLFVTYYSDPDDKVPHTPEVCGRQKGTVIHQIKVLNIDYSDYSKVYSTIPAKLLTFTRESGEKAITLYTFFVEGRFEQEREFVRWQIGKPGNLYTFYSKIEVNIRYFEDSELDATIETAKKVLTESLKVLLKEYFPNKNDVMRK